MAKIQPIQKTAITIPGPDARIIVFAIKGTSPLLVHAWSVKSKEQMRGKQQGAVKSRKREIRDPQAEYEASMYRDGDRYLMKSAAFRLAAVSAVRGVDGITMTEMRQHFYCPDEFVEIAGSPVMREDIVRVSNGQPDLRYRAEFFPWACKLPMRYNAGAISPEQVANLLLQAGMWVGVGEGRVEKGGTNGCFEFEAE